MNYPFLTALLALKEDGQARVRSECDTLSSALSLRCFPQNLAVMSIAEILYEGYIAADLIYLFT